MHRSPIFLAALIAFQSVSLGASLEAQKQRLPRMPEAALLLGWPSDQLTVTTGDHTSTLPGKANSWMISPSISADGHVIASALPGSDYELSRSEHWFTVGTYSVADNRWTEYPGLELSHGAVSISPDGTKLACVARTGPNGPSLFRILDLKTRKITEGQPPSQKSDNAITWSPDSRRVAFSADVEVPSDEPPVPKVFVMDVETGRVTLIANGWGPSWSPRENGLLIFPGLRTNATSTDGGVSQVQRASALCTLMAPTPCSFTSSSGR